MKVDGKALMLRLGGKTVALATDCAFEGTIELFDARTKDDDGPIDECGIVSGTLSTESLLGINDGKTQHTFATLFACFQAREKIAFEVILAAGASGGLVAEDWHPGPTTSKGFVSFGGWALITSLRLNGGVSGKAKMSIQLKAQGAMTPLPAAEFSAEVIEGTLYLSGNVEGEKSTLNLSEYSIKEPDTTLEL